MDQAVDKDSICQACGKNELVFAGPNTTEHFCQWLFSGENEGATVIAHNFKGYDSLPILEYMYQNGVNKGNNKVTELRAILQRESQNS